MRYIGQAAGCKMPTVYYYFKNKEELFDQVVRVQYEELVNRLSNEIPKDLSLQEACIYRIIRKKSLSEDDRLVYRLALKTWLGFEGCDVSRQKLLKWEQERYEQNKHQYAEVTSSLLWVKFITRGVANMIQRIILLDENPTDEEIREEISMILEVAAHSNSKQQ